MIRPLRVAPWWEHYRMVGYGGEGNWAATHTPWDATDIHTWNTMREWLRDNAKMLGGGNPLSVKYFCDWCGKELVNYGAVGDSFNIEIQPTFGPTEGTELVCQTCTAQLRTLRVNIRAGSKDYV